MNCNKRFLEYKAYQLRKASLTMTTMAGSGHPTSCLSAADLVAALFFYAMYIDPRDLSNPNTDEFILSKGHAAPLLYAAWKELGLLTEQDLLSYRQFNSTLEGHPTARFIYDKVATGSLGMGLSYGLGMALAARLKKSASYTYVLMGDSEIAEGSIWEAAELASYYKVDTLVGIVDVNRLGQSTAALHGWHAQRYADKFRSFGWNTLVIDGHDMQQIIVALDKARANKTTPTMIIAKTIKGYGIAQVENKEGFHGKAFDKSELPNLLAQLATRFVRSANFNPESCPWTPKSPSQFTGSVISEIKKVSLPEPSYKLGQMIAPRQAYGQALTVLGGQEQAVISLDAEVKNSTYAYLFEEKFPDRFFQCFIAEQNMVSMAVGFNAQKYKPFVSTFSVFFSRALDQIRMAAIGRSTIALVGSHAGVSIGQDGPSQMGLEDLAYMQAIPNSLIFYPSDAVSTYKLVGRMAEYNQGISYLRTTRMALPVIYDNQNDFKVGGCYVLKSSPKDVALVIAAGVTVHEALKAYDQLAQEGIFISVIDLYCVKPLDVQTIINAAQAAKNNVITVEDHYIQGGIGSAICYALRNHAMKIECLAVKEIPRSGLPQELLAWAGIDAAAIIKTVKSK